MIPLSAITIGDVLIGFLPDRLRVGHYYRPQQTLACHTVYTDLNATFFFNLIHYKNVSRSSNILPQPAMDGGPGFALCWMDPSLSTSPPKVGMGLFLTFH